MSAMESTSKLTVSAASKVMAVLSVDPNVTVAGLQPSPL